MTPRDLNDLVRDREGLPDLLEDTEPMPVPDSEGPTNGQVQAMPDPTVDPLPQVVVDTNMRRVVDEAEAGLREHAPRDVYVRSGRLVVLTREGSPATKALERPDVLHVHPLGTEALREALAASARFVELRGAKQHETPVLPPKWLALALAERGEWRLPPLIGLVHGPSLRADGSLLAVPGYDPASGLFADFNPAAFPSVPEAPTLDDARKALDVLREPFGEFPYVTEADRSVDLSAVLSIVGREAIEGPVPLHAADSPARGAGKSLRADAVALIGTGREADVSIQTTDTDEQRKALLSVALEGHTLVLFDNVDGAFGSGVIAAYLTARHVRDRRLGVVEQVSAPWRAVVLATGNNLGFRGDVGRRALLGTIDPKCENAEDRTGWKHDPLREWIRANRGALYVAALTVLRAFVVAGKPEHGRPRMGSFEGWDRLVRGALLWVGAADPCATRERVREDADTDLDGLRGVLAAWHRVFRGEAATISDALRRADPGLTDALLVVAPKRRKDGEPDPASVGNALRKARGKVLGGLRLVQAGTRDGSRCYRVESMDPRSGGDSGDSGDLFQPCTRARACAHAHGAGPEQVPVLPDSPSEDPA